MNSKSYPSNLNVKKTGHRITTQPAETIWMKPRLAAACGVFHLPSAGSFSRGQRETGCEDGGLEIFYSMSWGHLGMTEDVDKTRATVC